ncbi:MAG: hypothetical protein ACLFSV_12430, partial [Alkalispirochaeta sp.]
MVRRQIQFPPEQLSQIRDLAGAAEVALLRSRPGMDAVRDLTVEVLLVLTVQWVSETIPGPDGTNAIPTRGRDVPDPLSRRRS